MTRFAWRAAKVDAAVDREHGERTRIEGRLAGEFLAGALDPARPPYDAVGVVDAKPQVMQRRQQLGSSAADMVEVAGDFTDVTYTAARLGPRARWPRQHDRIVRLDEPGEPSLLVSRADYDGISRLVCRCVPEKAA